MGTTQSKIQVVVLAAGQGKRMGLPDLPKVLVPFRGKPLIEYLLEAVAASEVCAKPVIVVGQKADKVRAVLGPGFTYIFQTEQLGTGHAVACTQAELEDRAENIMVLYGDHPLITVSTIKQLADTHLRQGAVITMATVKLPDFGDWRQTFSAFGRVLRGQDGQLLDIVESKDATEEQLASVEVNPAYYCFRAEWLWQHLTELGNNNAQKEFYLTDLIGLARKRGEAISTIDINPCEALGVNTADQLELISLVSKR